MQIYFLWMALLGAVGQLPDRGIYPELASPLSPELALRGELRLRFDPVHKLLTISDDEGPLTVYPIAFVLAPTAPKRAADLLLHAGDIEQPTGNGVTIAMPAFEQLQKMMTDATSVENGAPSAKLDRDRDGIVDGLDIALGAKKLLRNRAKYIERYVTIPYPNGDVPRSEGVCSDTVVRALRNAGIDLQREIHDDVVAHRAAYPMVERVDTSINHRRVKTLLPWFVRHFATLARGSAYRPGDIVFFDTFPSRPGPDHLGVVSDRIGASGLPLVINNWSEGSVDAEMDLLSWVPVTHHFRVK